MASMYQRGKWWHAKWFENGVRKRMALNTTSKARARAKLVEIEQALEAGRPVGHRKDISLDEFNPLFLKHIQTNKRPHTTKAVAHIWKHFTAWAKPIRLGDVTPERIAEYKAHLQAQDYANSTIRSNLLTLSSVFTVAIKEMHVLEGENPVKGIDLPKSKERFPRYLSGPEIDKLLAAAKAHSRDMHLLVALAVFAGLRKNELVNARWSWIDFHGRGRILVQSEGRFATKSGKDRKVPMSSRLRAILEEYPETDLKRFILWPDKHEKDGEETVYRCDFTQAFRTVCKSAGFTDVTPHTLRHTFASQHAIAGTSLYKIGQWLGHASVATTQIYAHLSPDDPDIDRW